MGRLRVRLNRARNLKVRWSCRSVCPCLCLCSPSDRSLSPPRPIPRTHHLTKSNAPAPQINITQGPEILGMSNCLVVFTFEGRREESSVRVNDIAPTWGEDFVFDQVAYPPS